MKHLIKIIILVSLTASPAWGASPSVAATNTSVGLVSTSHVVALPTGIVAGQLLMVGLGCNGILTAPSASGWTHLHTFARSADNTNTISVLYKWAAGSEGSTVTVTTSGSQPCGHFSMSITGAVNPATQAPEASTGATGSAAPDSDAVTSTGGAKDYLFISVASQDGNSVATASPTNYLPSSGPFLTVSSGTDNALDAGVFAAYRQLNASSEDPGVFTSSRGDGTAAFTIAVHPAAATTTTDQSQGQML